VRRVGGSESPLGEAGPLRVAASADSAPTAPVRRFPIGSEITARGVHFRVWAPERERVEVVLEKTSTSIALAAESGGYFSALAPDARAGDRYRFRLDGNERLLPDPASRFQPDGPHGPSEIVDPHLFSWTDGSWRGVERVGQVLYEMHIGTFTREGTWAAAVGELPKLAELGITVLEIMPIAEFPGRFGWGYDGVNWFAPTRLYGAPDDVRRFVDRAHSLGLGVILDVVYNHFGPDGNYITQFTKSYASENNVTEWGAALNFDGENCLGVREFVVQNARYWIEEFHLDGLRLDATQQVFDGSATHILAELASVVRQAAGQRSTYLVAENETQEAKLVRPRAKGGHGLDAVWNDDYHHSAMVALTGRSEAYYSDYGGTAQELLSAVKRGFLHQGQRSAWQKKRRGHPALDLDPASFVLFMQNHDQVANSCRGQRVHLLTSPGRYRALTMLTLLAPATPMLFQGQEFAASAPFLFFADHNEELAKLVREGRRAFLAQFPSLALSETQCFFDDPGRPSTFELCKLDFSEREKHAATYALHRDLIALRQRDPVFRKVQRGGSVDGFVLNQEAFAVRMFGEEAGDRLLVVNLGRQLHPDTISDPLFAPPERGSWQKVLSSSDATYGGDGTPPLESERGIDIPAECAIFLAPSEP
jgi:maltooligosyltrehalose trehalohydrolase